MMSINLIQALNIIQSIDELEQIQKRLKTVFAKDELDGGWKAALDHPLYLEAQAEIDHLSEELKMLI